MKYYPYFYSYVFLLLCLPEQKFPPNQQKFPAEPGRFYNLDKGFSIRLPEEWEVSKDKNGARSKPENFLDSFLENVQVIVIEFDKPTNLENFYKRDQEEFMKGSEEYNKYEGGQTVIDNNEAKWVVESAQLKGWGHRHLTYLGYYLVKEHRGYLILCASTPVSFSKYRSKFEEIAKSFKFE